jgi:hypothetical protein
MGLGIFLNVALINIAVNSIGRLWVHTRLALQCVRNHVEDMHPVHMKRILCNRLYL